MKSTSENDIFKHEIRDNHTRYSAIRIVDILIELTNPESVIDVGCGVGTFLKAFKNKGVKYILGLDSTNYLNTDYLEIPHTNFIDCNLEKKYPVIDKQFDLALSLEVAEHLDPNSAKKFVAFLTELSGCVYFSAAIPGQGGVGHVNEQWPEYWIELFDKRDYNFIDCIRPIIWYDKKIKRWYKMNSCLFVKRESKIYDRLNTMNIRTGAIPSIVHPDHYSHILSKKEDTISKLKAKLKREKKYSLLRFPRMLARLFR